MEAHMDRKRGRPKKEEQAERIVRLLRQDLLVLDQEAVLVDCKGVQRLCAMLEGEIFQSGAAIKLLMDGAVMDVCGELASSPTRQSQRLSSFLWAWYFEDQSVAAIARQLQLDRTYVGRSVKAPSLTLVVHHFLMLSRLDDPLQASDGLREALRLHQEAKSQAHKRARAPRSTSLLTTRNRLDGTG
jgi:hypothetical protein